MRLGFMHRPFYFMCGCREHRYSGFGEGFLSGGVWDRAQRQRPPRENTYVTLPGGFFSLLSCWHGIAYNEQEGLSSPIGSV